MYKELSYLGEKTYMIMTKASLFSRSQVDAIG